MAHSRAPRRSQSRGEGIELLERRLLFAVFNVNRHSTPAASLAGVNNSRNQP